MPSVEGLPARRAALQILDAVLRRGRTLDSAAQGARDLKPADQALAVAIAGEVLRRKPDLDALIDGATRQRLPDDSKARMVLRVALAQKIGLATPEHALVATALPLVDGGPRRLVHGVLGTLLRRGVPPMDAPRLPEAVEHVIGHSGLLAHYRNEKDGEDRVENLQELVNAAQNFVREADFADAPMLTDRAGTPPGEGPQEGAVDPLTAFLAHASLEAGDTQAADGRPALQLMTMHSAKGLEFRAEFLMHLLQRSLEDIAQLRRRGTAHHARQQRRGTVLDPYRVLAHLHGLKVLAFSGAERVANEILHRGEHA